MHLSFGLLIEATWLLWALYWAWGARGVKAAAREDDWTRLLAYRIPVMLGFALLIALGQGVGHPWLYRHVPSAGAERGRPRWAGCWCCRVWALPAGRGARWDATGVVPCSSSRTMN